MNRSNFFRLCLLVALVLTTTLFHYITTTQEVYFHDIFRRLYYVPVVLGGLWFSLRGGIATALAVSILYAPHVVFQWGVHPSGHVEQYLEILLYNVIGFLTGFLTQREATQKIRYQKTAERLEKSYAKLREQADLVLQIEEQLVRASRLSALGELSAGLAHEIRNPLGAIRGTAEILQDGIPTSDDRYEFTSIMIKEVDRLNKVLNDFLQFARGTPVDHAPFGVNETLDEVLALVRMEVYKGKIEVNHIKAEVPLLSGDREKLKQVFLNIILNSIQAMPAGGKLTLSSETVEGNARIRFSDTGSGIPPENLDRIFNPFFTTRQEGTGLGLAITHRIVQGHGGNLDVESQEGKGTTITLTLPLVAA